MLVTTYFRAIIHINLGNGSCPFSFVQISSTTNCKRLSNYLELDKRGIFCKMFKRGLFPKCYLKERNVVCQFVTGSLWRICSSHVSKKPFVLFLGKPFYYWRIYFVNHYKIIVPDIRIPSSTYKLILMNNNRNMSYVQIYINSIFERVFRYFLYRNSIFSFLSFMGNGNKKTTTKNPS